jgi:K+/H+ antiporter YhaU regulatory subunit KhtT
MIGGLCVGRLTGLTVLGIRENGLLDANPGPDTLVGPDAELLAIGDDDQVRRFRELAKAGPGR